jgi:glycine dehydrogenase
MEKDSNRLPLELSSNFIQRHIGVSETEIASMLKSLKCSDLGTLMSQAVPDAIRMDGALQVGDPMREEQVLAELRELASENQLWKTYIGAGYYGTVTPASIKRNILENPGWYTQYTPYQAEIAQGRLEALLNFQTMVSDLTGLPVANASLLDEATAAAEAMQMAYGISGKPGTKEKFFVSVYCHPQTRAVLETRARGAGIEILIEDEATFDFSQAELFGGIFQYPRTSGELVDYSAAIEALHANRGTVVFACDLLSLTLLKEPGAWGADIAIGSSQRFGVPMGYGGPHAAFFATKDQHKRRIPGRLVGVSKDSDGKPAYRLALQTREQHIRREKATSNICTAQVLLAVIAGAYAVYHGPEGLTRIASDVRRRTLQLKRALELVGFTLPEGERFDTLAVEVDDLISIRDRAEAHEINLRYFEVEKRVGISIDETTTDEDIARLIQVFAGEDGLKSELPELTSDQLEVEPAFKRSSAFLEHEVFHSYRTEHELLRYLKKLENRDLSLAHSMIPLGSCTMKLNAAAEMEAVTWPAFGQLHPFVPKAQAKGYQRLFQDLEAWLGDVTGFDAVSLQPNSGAQGEYAGLMVIRSYHEAQGNHDRKVCLIPTSAHGTNPASAVMAGFEVVPLKTESNGNIDLADLEEKVSKHRERLGALMITYPSTYGVFETEVRRICDTVHEAGGQVYLDGANLNAQLGLCRPGDYGADVCHLNLHKTFCIPHGGGGPGMGPIGVKSHLAAYLPGHPVVEAGGRNAMGPVSAGPYGSPSILPISWAYIRLMGSEGLKLSSEVAILSANYMAERLESYYRVLYRGHQKRVAHECIIDLRPYKEVGIEAEDVAKRLMDYGFHSPTLSWPVIGTMMIEPTESESKEEIDRYCDAMIAIHGEIQKIAEGKIKLEESPLKNAPHTAAQLTANEWNRAYTREEAGYPLPWVRESKFWPHVSRIDNVYGDRNLVCSCPSMDEYGEA